MQILFAPGEINEDGDGNIYNPNRSVRNIVWFAKLTVCLLVSRVKRATKAVICRRKSKRTASPA